MALASPPRSSTAVTGASIQTRVCQWSRLVGAKAKQTRITTEARRGTGVGQGRDKRSKNAIQEIKVNSVRGAREGGEDGSEATHANVGRKEHACWW
jgi:hypothetical protein